VDGDTSNDLGNIGFAQFTAALITQTLDAVIAAQLQQEEKIRKLRESAGLTPAQFAEEAVSPEDVENELARLFPPDQYPKGIMAGAPYTPASQTQPEEPPIYSYTGYEMQKGDWVEQDNVIVITENGYKNILTHVRLTLATEHHTNILLMMRSGIPRIVIDHGRVNTKLFFQFSSGGIGKGSSTLQRGTLPQLMVKAVELRRPEVARLTVNVVGEVEITFKTISE
jgi:hypothetical protein